MKNMSVAIDELHQKAMKLAEEAYDSKQSGKPESAQAAYLSAFEYEKAAAMLLINEYDHEPSRSVLFRSAACLLLNLPFPTLLHLREAERMVAHGLSGNPPAEIAHELREAWTELMGLFKQKAA